MSHRSGLSSSRMPDNHLFTLQSMQHQFERLNMVLGDVKDRIDHRDAAIRKLQCGGNRRQFELSEEDLGSEIGVGRQRRDRCEKKFEGNLGGRDGVGNLASLKTNIPSFQIRTDPHNNFHTRCHVNNKVCNMIIDRKSCLNLASTTLIEKLNLPTLKHSHPYTLQWLKDCGEVRVDRQVLVSFSMGKYHDEVLCDVVPMHAAHILLGKPWMYERKVTHDKLSNMYSFVKEGKTIKLAPLTPTPVFEDQMGLKREIAKKRAIENEGAQNNKSENESAQSIFCTQEIELKKSESESAQNRKSTKEIEQIRESEKESEQNRKSTKEIEQIRESEKESEQKRKSKSEDEQEKSREVAENKARSVEPREQKENESYLNLDEFSSDVSFLQTFAEEMSNELPLVRSITPQIDFMIGAAIPNQPAYGNNLEETFPFVIQSKDSRSNPFEERGDDVIQYGLFNDQETNIAQWAAILGIQRGLPFWAIIYLEYTWNEANTKPNIQDRFEDGEAMFLHLIQAIT